MTLAQRFFLLVRIESAVEHAKMWGTIRCAVEAGAVTLLGALAGYWLELFVPDRIHTVEAHRVAILEQSVWGAALAAMSYVALRIWEASRDDS